MEIPQFYNKWLLLWLLWLILWLVDLAEWTLYVWLLQLSNYRCPITANYPIIAANCPIIITEWLVKKLWWLWLTRCHRKGSTFSIVILRPWVLVQSVTWNLHLLHSSWALDNLSRPNHNENWKYSGCLNKLNVASEGNHQNLYLIGCLEQCDKMKKFWVDWGQIAMVWESHSRVPPSPHWPPFPPHPNRIRKISTTTINKFHHTGLFGLNLGTFFPEKIETAFSKWLLEVIIHKLKIY